MAITIAITKHKGAIGISLGDWHSKEEALECCDVGDGETVLVIECYEGSEQGVNFNVLEALALGDMTQGIGYDFHHFANAIFSLGRTFERKAKAEK